MSRALPGFADGARMRDLLRGLPRVHLGTEPLLLVAALVFATLTSAGFWRDALAGRNPAEVDTWRFAACTLVLLTAAHFLPLALVATRRTVRPLLAVLFTAGVFAAHYAGLYGVVIDPGMLRNVLRTDPAEALELVGPALLAPLALALLGTAVLSRVIVERRPWQRALVRRLAWTATVLALAVSALLLVFQDFGSLMRNQRTLRYEIAPANVVYGLARVLAGDARMGVAARAGRDTAVRRAAPGRRPVLFVMVVGETVRSANFGLDGYARDTTPGLRELVDLVNFPRTEACGTSTEVSLPCMFSPFGRADYDEVEIRRTDSLLHVLDAAGLKVTWRDNQSGCKGVCTGLETEDVSSLALPGLCDGTRCLDEVLLHRLEGLAARGGDQVLVLHMLGNHGPAYFRRYPPAFERFTPACRKNELRECSREEIVNAYDNAVLYTDHVLTRLATFLQARAATRDVGLVYVSDHGESLGENGLYLHGLPRAVAPREQLEVPMLWWLPPASARGFGADPACLRERARRPASHDVLYHSVLGLLDIDTPRYRAERDLFSGCRRLP